MTIDIAATWGEVVVIDCRKCRRRFLEEESLTLEELEAVLAQAKAHVCE